MKQIILVVMLITLLVGGCSACNLILTIPDSLTAKYEQQALITRMNKATVIIISKNNDDKELKNCCTGVWIDKHHVLTAQHCLSTATLNPYQYILFKELADQGKFNMIGRPLKIAVYEDVKFDKAQGASNVITKAYDAVVVQANVVHDLALIKVIDYEAQYWGAIATKELSASDRIHAVSHPGSLLYSYSTGYVSFAKRSFMLDYNKEQASPVIQVDSGMWFGSSGGAVWNDAGQVIGIVIAMRDKEPSLMLITHFDSINDFLSKR